MIGITQKKIFQVLIPLWSLKKFLYHYFHAPLLVQFFWNFTQLLYFVHVALCSCCTFAVLHTFHIALFSCCTLFLLHLFRVAISLCSTLSMLHFFRIALFSCSAISFLHAALFSFCTFFVLHSFHAPLWCVNFCRTGFL